jgi:hypothetical protein
VSNRPRKHRIITADHLFPKKTPPSIFEQMFTASKMRAHHEIEIREIGPRIFEVLCTEECGFAAPAYGEEHAARIKENHYARFHVIHDPLGAKYRD